MNFYPVQSPLIGFFKTKSHFPITTHPSYVSYGNEPRESYAKNHAIVFLSVYPADAMIRSAEHLCQDGYRVYIVMDDNTKPLPAHDSSKVTLVRYNQGVAEAEGYTNSVLWVKDRASSRCKALYHFAHLPHTYDYVWMIEDDVFVPSKNTIRHLDELYPTGDLLCTGNEKNTTGELTSWPWWEKINGKIDLPWSKSMISAIRVSPALLRAIDTYATKHKTLLFDEAMFTTLALHHQLSIVNPPELGNIVYWHKQWDVNEFKPFHMYHPVKNWDQHVSYKKQMGMELATDL